MIKRIIGALAFAVAAASPASAADWGGFYLGLNAGGGMGNSQLADSCYFCATENANPAFAAVGGQIGDNWQMGAAVVGIEGDFDWDSLDHKGILGGSDSNELFYKQRLDWFSSIRGRVGLGVDNALLYLTAGPAFGQINTPGIEYCVVSYCGGTPNPKATGNTFSVSGTRMGMAAGGGIEFKTDDAWSFRVEYLYADFGSATAYLKGPSTCSTGETCTVQNSLSTQMIRVAFNYHLGN